jgi:hypothetical protein
MPYLISSVRLDESRSVALSRTAIDRLFAVLAASGDGRAEARWERELVAWLENRRDAVRTGDRPGLDLSEIAWTPERFPEQRAFLLALIDAAGETAAGRDPELEPALAALRGLAADYPREFVVVGRRWTWAGRAPELR